MMRSSLLVVLLLGSTLVADMSFEEWQRAETQAFVNYQTQIDKEFVEMLRNEWREYHSLSSPLIYKRPKPPKQPILKPKPKPKEVIKVTPLPVVVPNIPKFPKKEPMVGYERVGFDFFGIEIDIVYDEKLKLDIQTLSSEKIASFWNHTSSCNYIALIKQIEEYQDRYGLDGWATYLLVTTLTAEISDGHNMQNLLNWFILVKLKMDVKVGFSEHQVTLLVSNQEMIYGFRHFRVDGKKYYQFNRKENSKLYIYQEGSRSIMPITFANKTTKLPLDIKNRELRFSYKNRAYVFNVQYNKNLVDLYATYPHREHNQYGQLSTLSKKFIHESLSSIVSNMNQIEAINFLLRLTQNGFTYKTDGDNFGKEKVMFFEETLYYEYSDCEDRAIFFAVLVAELIDVDIVLILYPNHLATAIKLNSEIGGESVIYQNQKYYIADPTYNNANIGQAMPQLKGQEIKILTTRN